MGPGGGRGRWLKQGPTRGSTGRYAKSRAGRSLLRCLRAPSKCAGPRCSRKQLCGRMGISAGAC